MKPELWIKYTGYVLCFLLISLFGYWYVNRPNADSIRIVASEYADGEKIIVEVAGEVKKPGLYSVQKGTTIHDCIYMAGGITKDGNAESIKPDKIVYEPCKIEVGRKTQYDVKAQFGKGDYSSQNPCDINSATKDQLMKLPGIGETLALRIINYRETVGEFKESDQIMQVDGIGKGKYEEIKDLIIARGEN